MSLKSRATNLKNIYQEFPTPFWTLVGATFVDRLGGWLLFPFFSLYLTEKFNVGLTEVGYVFAIFALFGILGSFVGGALTDKFGRKWMLLFGLVVSGLSSLLMGIIDNIYLFYLAAGIVGLFAQAGGPAQDAMVADLLPEEKRSEGYGILRVAANLSAALGPALGGFIATRSFMALFVGDAATSLVTAVIVYFLLPETKPQPREDEEEQSFSQTMVGYTQVFRDGAFMLFIFFSIIITGVYMQMNSTLPVYLRDFHNIPGQGYGLLLTINAAMVVLFQFWITRRIARYPAFLMMTLGTVLYGIGFAMFGFVATFAMFILAIVILTIGEMVTVPTAQTLVAGFSPEDMRGRYMAMYGFSWAIPSVFGPLGAGIIMDNYNPDLVWYLSGILAGISALGYVFLHLRIKERVEPTLPEAEPSDTPAAEAQA